MMFADRVTRAFSGSGGRARRGGFSDMPTRAFSKTRVMSRGNAASSSSFAAGTSREDGRETIDSRDSRFGVLPWEANVTLLFDASKSMPQSALDYVFSEGLQAIFSALSATQASAGYRYNLRIAAFSSGVKEILPFTSLEEAKKLCYRAPQAAGVTMLEEAMRDVFDKTDELKREQDGAYPRRPRVGSLVVVVTDGRPTDCHGNRQPLSRALVREIAERNETRKTTTFAIGMGNAHDDILKELGPTSFLFEQGSYREVPHAIRYKGETYDDVACWRTACDIIGSASSSRSGSPSIVYRGSIDPVACEDVVEIDPERYAIVR